MLGAIDEGGMTVVRDMSRKFNIVPTCYALVFWIELVVLACGSASAQLPTTLRGVPGAQICFSPLGALLPECQEQPTASVPRSSQPAPPSPSRPSSSPSVEEATNQGAPAQTEAAEESSSEFQRYAASVLGQPVARFGSALFSRTPSTFAPVDRVPVPANYIVGPGDEILLRVWGQINLDTSLTVDRNGSVFIPQVGEFRIAGIEAQHLRNFLKAQLERVYRNFDLTATLGQLRSLQIYVTGAARRPGSYTIGSLSTLVSAVFASGGPSLSGTMRRVELRRGQQVVASFDLYDLLVRGDKSADVTLEQGDVIHYPPVGRQVALGGSALRPGIYELKDGETLDDLLRHSGGLTPLADRGRILIERANEDGTRSLVTVSLTSAGALKELKSGDVIRILPISPRTKEVVTLRGNVASPGKYPWFPGMRLRDLIPSREFLLTREYWLHRDRLGRMRPEDVEPFAEKVLSSKEGATLSLDVPEINWEYAIIERRDSNRLGPRLIPFRLAGLLIETDEKENHELHPDDVVTIFSQKDFPVAIEHRTRLVRISGEVRRAGWYPIGPDETLGQLLARAGGLTKHAYPEGLVFTRVSARQAQQQRIDFLRARIAAQAELEAQQRSTSALSVDLQEEQQRLEQQRRILAGLSSLQASGRVVLPVIGQADGLAAFSAVALEDGDEIHIPERPGVVHVFGEVNNAGTLLHYNDYRVRDYLQMAGGYTRYSDRKKAFVIRCDGTVVDRRKRAGVKFENLRLYPGDALVVPPKMTRVAVMRELRDVSQVFAQLALGAAAINVLR